MERLCEILIDRRKAVFLVMMALTVISLLLIPHVNVNTDMTKYLPDSSVMKQGVDILAEEFPEMSVPNTVRVMFRELPEEEKAAFHEKLKETPNADSVLYVPGDQRYEKDGCTLYILHFSCGFFSREMQEAEAFIRSEFAGKYGMICVVDKTTQPGVPLWIFALALSILLVILILMSPSFVEPFLFLFSMGTAVLINTGTDVFLPSVSETTYSIAAILQLALSVDYSVILMGRYRQELKSTADRPCAMKRAVKKAFSSVTGSALTTVAGLLVLVFMSFRIGMDMGIVLAKGVFLSMICVFTVLPTLVLAFDTLIRKTARKQLVLNMRRLTGFSYRHCRGISIFFVMFFTAMLILKGSTGIAFTLVTPNEIDPVFPKENQIVVLYENSDEEAAGNMIPLLEEDPAVNSVTAWANTLGKAFTAEELSDFMASMGMDLRISPAMLKLFYQVGPAAGGDGRMTIREMLTYASENLGEGSFFGNMMTDDMKKALEDAPAILEEGEKQLKSDKHSIMAVSTSLPGESEETTAFMERLEAVCDDSLQGNYYLIGNTPMALEMVSTFSGEMNFLTILTAAAIFLVVFFTFHSPVVPAILVLLIQSAVYATMVMMNLQGMTIYYLALLVVQSILMGATIDYAIVFTNYYREFRKSEGIREALLSAYNGSVHTILTSGLIMVSVTGIVGFAYSDPSIRQIVHTISRGAAFAILLVLFVLPGLLAALDRFVTVKEKR